LTPTIRTLVLGMTAVFVFYVCTPPLNEWVISHLLLGPGLLRGELWQLGTAVFVSIDFVSWLFTIIGLWWVGAFVERERGTRFFILLFLGSGLLANVMAALVTWALAGPLWVPRADGAAYAIVTLFVVFARMWGSRPAQIWGALTMRADYFTWIIVGLGVAIRLARLDWPGLAADVAAIVTGLVVTGGIGQLRELLARRQTPRRYQVIEGGGRRKPYLN
jgi:membrane associated rhomboid family serine protease